MSQTKYLIIGSSHAGLAAMEAIRMQDAEGALTMVSREKTLPYSPTVLPYVVSGEKDPEKVFLRGQGVLDGMNVNYMSGKAVKSVDSAANSVVLDSGEAIRYEKLLIASGASPELPPIPGLDSCPSYVLRTLEDALKIKAAMASSQSAIILGGGLIGMHAAENLAKAGLEVTVVEMLPQVLPGYFDAQAAGMIQKVFADNGVRILTGSAVTHVTASNAVCAVSLENGLDLSAHMLIVATGVRANMGFLNGSAVKTDKGILVDEAMRTSVGNIWAAGDVAQADAFAGPGKILNGILPDAVEQGVIAGMAMVDDPSLKPYRGGIPMNTYSFFGNRAFSVGVTVLPEGGEGFEVDLMVSPSSVRYQKLVFEDGLLVGVSAINATLDPGVLSEIIRRQVELSGVKEKFAAAPLEMGRVMMSNMWR